MRQNHLLYCFAVAVIAVGSVLPSASAIGPVRIESFEKEFWEERVVIIATVKDLTPPEDVSKPTRLRLDPIATVTGELDAAQLGAIDADVDCNAFSLVT
jgi:hypothetical protein